MSIIICTDVPLCQGFCLFFFFFFLAPTELSLANLVFVLFRGEGLEREGCCWGKDRDWGHLT